MSCVSGTVSVQDCREYGRYFFDCVECCRLFQPWSTNQQQYMILHFCVFLLLSLTIRTAVSQSSEHICLLRTYIYIKAVQRCGDCLSCGYARARECVYMCDVT